MRTAQLPVSMSKNTQPIRIDLRPGLKVVFIIHEAMAHDDTLAESGIEFTDGC